MPRVTMQTAQPRRCLAVAVGLMIAAVLAGCQSENSNSDHRQSDQQCAPGVRRVGAGSDVECIGITDGAYSFAPELGLQDVMAKIKQENDQVVQRKGARPYWSVAVVVPLPRRASSLSEALRHELQGAYLAQYRANETSELGDQPAIRLLVANVGEKADQWQLAGDMLDARVTIQDESLVAVTGLGQSLESTKKLIELLEQGQGLQQVSHLPMIATRLTADNLSTSPDPGRVIQGLMRISPTNSDQIGAVAGYLTGTSTLLVEDTNVSDAYTHSLGTAITQAFSNAPPGSLLESERYNSALPGARNAFVQMMPGICVKNPKAIYYGGRGEDLSAFLSALAGRPCPQQKMSVFTGDDGVDLTAKLRRQITEGNNQEIVKALAPESNISLRYTDVAHPDAWTRFPQLFNHQAIGRFQADCAGTCFSLLFPNDKLDDGAAIASYDAMLVAVTAIRAGYTPSLRLGEGPGAVQQQLYRFNSTSPVQGASGPIYFNQEGKPENKPISVLQLNNDGTLTLVDLIHK